MGEEFSFSYSLGDAGGSPERKDRRRPQDRFAVADLSEHHLGGGAMLARNPHNGRRMVLAAEVLNALSHCRNFRTMDEHLAELMEDGPASAERSRAIRAILQSVRDGGLTLSASDLCALLAPRAAGDVAGGQPIAAIITCDRPFALQRLLDSIEEACELEKLHRFFVVDDSRDAANRQRNREQVDRFAGRAACPVAWFGPQQAAERVDALVQRLPELETPIRFLADRSRWADFTSTGVSRNMAQLLSVGHPLIVFDDDAVCRLYRPRFVQAGLEFSTGRRQAEFFEDSETQSGHRLRDGEDVVRRLNRCLGLSIPEALAALGIERLEPSAWRHADARLASVLGPESRVLVTECGTIGDPGTQDYSWLATLPPESTQRLARDQGQAALALRQAHCWLGVDRPTFAPNANFSQITGFDNRDFLPPYFPFGRGQDRVFGETVRFLYPRCVTLIHPWAALHLRVETGAAAKRPQGGAKPAGFPGYLTFLPLEGGGACHSSHLPDRLRSLAAAFTDLGRSPPETLFRLHAEQRLREDATNLEGLERSLQLSSGGDADWIDWLRRQRSSGRAAMDREPAAMADDERLGQWRNAWTGFAAGLRAWPEIREAARALAMHQ